MSRPRYACSLREEVCEASLAASSVADNDLATVGSCRASVWGRSRLRDRGFALSRRGPPYAAILGTLVMYPLMVAAWWPRGRGR
jgi:hypothetical protein